MTPTEPSADVNPPAEAINPAPALRWMSNLLCLWALCAKPACARARTCKGKPHWCLARHAPLTPVEARAGVAAMLAGRQRGLGYDALRAQAPQDIAAAEDWIARVHASLRAARAQEQSARRRLPSALPRPT